MIDKSLRTLPKNAPAEIGLKDQLDALTNESTEEERLTVALAMIMAGSAAYNAARKTGVDLDLLRKHFAASQTPEQRIEMLERSEGRILLQAMDAVEIAADKVLDLIEKDQIRPSEIIKFLQVMRDTVATKMKWTAPLPPPPEPEKEEPLLKRLLDKLESGAIRLTQEKVVDGELVEGERE